MNIVAVNGSPKPQGSLSGRIIEDLGTLLEKSIETYHAARLVKGVTPPETLGAILEADALLLVFPLYVDSLPATLIEFLTRLEEAAQVDHTGRQAARVFVVVNCGFHEAEQTACALAMAEHFASRAGFVWGGGVGIGGGGMLGAFTTWKNGPAKPVWKALCRLAEAVREGSTQANVFASPAWPRFLYQIQANFGFWREAKRRGIRSKDLRAQPYLQAQGD